MRFKKAGKKLPRKATTKNLSPKAQAARAGKGAKRGPAKKAPARPAEPVVLTGGQRRALRAQAHALHPLVQVGHKGVSSALIEELREALEAHELVKVRLGRHAPEERADTADALVQKTGAAVVQTIGHVVLLYRPAADPAARKVVLAKASKAELAREAGRTQNQGAEAARPSRRADEAFDDEDELETEDLGDEDEGDEDEGDEDAFDGELDDEGEDDADDLYDALDEDE